MVDSRWTQLFFFAAEVVVTLEHLHGMNIAFRDLKPENILLDATGHLKLVDFGFAKIVDDKTWTLCGTQEYLAPEVIQTKGHGQGVDWWALGSLIFEILAGYPPFYDDSPFAMYQKILAARVSFPRHFDVKVKDIIKRFLTVDRGRRLGCSRKGVCEVKAHRWFRDVQWETVASRGLVPVHIPEVSGFDDTSNFGTYPESQDSAAASVARGPLASQFDNF
mmetsp:Transcript_68799/g.157887  ORF Transcript_68799/g.157887 Transcript_68799/m.157887 type:complete len:220 (-) Transcript_68799:75-734(-)